MEGPLAAARIIAAEAGRAPCNTTPPGKSRLLAEVGGFGEEIVAQGANVSGNGSFCEAPAKNTGTCEG